eukprot:TRINITY_DN3790_c0_g1_i2.p1 TRINITY_DN3790_c0_g1~~TRINITY_DN3790_c0_g1_i2.p1  ORF type:complete len:272 (-),score=37.97 TRINITY_DN3790_c0_g1_i2:278-1015(-)
MEEGERLLQYSIQVIFNESFHNILPFECVKCLSLVSKSIHNTVKSFIEANYWFNLDSVDKRVTHYLPIKVFDIVNLSQITLSPNEINDTIKQKFLNSITHLKFHRNFNSPIYNRLLLPNLQQLYFSQDFNYPISAHNLPCNITLLQLGHFFNQPISSLPSSIKHLAFSWCFNQPLSTSNLPQSLTHLFVSRRFNQPLPSLPLSVVEVTFRGANPCFNHSVAHLNPNIKFQYSVFGMTIPYKYAPK